MGCLLSKAIEDNPLPLSDALPCDIMLDVLSRVPSKSLMRFRCVSKSWYNLHSESHFTNMHANRVFKGQFILRDDKGFLYSLDFRNSNHRLIHIDHKRFRGCTKIWGSCDGLLCMQRDSDELFLHPLSMSDFEGLCIWNPSTKECMPLPLIAENRYTHVTYGFSYNSKNKNSEVVCIICEGSSIGSKVLVYSLGNDSWKRVADMIPYRTWNSKHGVVVNGLLHWAAVSTGERRSNLLIAYKAEDEKFMEVELPNLINNRRMPMSIGDFQGKLSLFHMESYSSKDFSLWVMNVHGLKESWMKLFTIARPTSLADIDDFLLGMTKTGLVVMRGDQNNLILYDPISSFRYEIHRKPHVVQMINI